MVHRKNGNSDQEKIQRLSGLNVAARMRLFRQLPGHQQSRLLLMLPSEIQQATLRKLRNSELVELLDYLDPDHATDLLQKLPGKKRREQILENLKKSIREKVEFLLEFHPESAAGLMDLNYLQLASDTTFQQAAEAMREHEARTGKIPTLLVEEDGLLIGELPAHELALHSPKSRVGRHLKHLPTLYYHENKNKVIDLFKNNPHNKVVVLDADESILGVIYSDDIISLLNKQAAKALYDYAGVRQEEDVFDSARRKVQSRYKWLIINLGTAFLAAWVISLFQDTIDKVLLLAVYMPVVAGMGGNAGTQTLAVMVRGIALKEITLKNCSRALINEILGGVFNGLIIGIIVALAAAIWNQSPLLGVVLGVSMVANLIIAGFFGAIIPLILKRLGNDPATSASIFITTATDVFGFLVFLGLGTILLT